MEKSHLTGVQRGTFILNPEDRKNEIATRGDNSFSIIYQPFKESFSHIKTPTGIIYHAEYKHVFLRKRDVCRRPV
jgi:hypothetical protein